MTATTGSPTVSVLTLVGALGAALIAGTILLLNERNKRITEADKLSKQLARVAGTHLLEAVEAAYRERRVPGSSTNPDDADINKALSEVKIACTDASVLAAQGYVFAYFATAPPGDDEDRTEDRTDKVKLYHGARSRYIDALREATSFQKIKKRKWWHVRKKTPRK